MFQAQFKFPKGASMAKRFWVFVFIFYNANIASAAPPDPANSWAYWLQHIDLDVVRSSPYDVFVIDYSADGGEDTAFSSEEIDSVKQTGKTVLAYMSIGEAEEGRFYFKKRWAKNGRLKDGAPRFLIASNPNFPDNYKVRFYKKKWKRIIFGKSSGRRKSYLDRIIDAGFDGVYLDIIDAFEHRKIIAARGERRAAQDMATFVVELATYARVTRGKPDFTIFPQNGARILDLLSDEGRSEYLSTIDGIGAEDTFYFGDEDENNSLNPQTETLNYLREFKTQGKLVVSIDYLTDPALIANFKTLACTEGFLPQVSIRDLSNIESHALTGCSD